MNFKLGRSGKENYRFARWSCKYWHTPPLRKNPVGVLIWSLIRFSFPMGFPIEILLTLKKNFFFQWTALFVFWNGTVYLKMRQGGERNNQFLIYFRLIKIRTGGCVLNWEKCEMGQVSKQKWINECVNEISQGRG